MACCRGHGYLPILLGIILLFCVVFTYTLAVYLDDVSPFFPYISDTGANRPESSIFSELLNIAATCAFLVMYLRYKLIREITQDFDTVVTNLARVNFGFGILSCVGLSLVANFQENDPNHVNALHFIGAGLLFVLGVVYIICDTVTSFRMCPAYNGSYICKVRLVFCILALLGLLSMVAAGTIATRQASAGWTPLEDRQHWSKDDPGYTAHVISTASEWALACAFILYFYTFIKDFQKFTIDIKLRLSVSHLDEEPFQSYPSETTRLLV